MNLTVLPTNNPKNAKKLWAEKLSERLQVNHRHRTSAEGARAYITFFFPISPLRVKIKGRSDPPLQKWTKNKELLRNFSWNCLESIQGTSLHYKIAFKQSTLPYGFEFSAGCKFSFYLPRSQILAIFWWFIKISIIALDFASKKI